MLRPLKLESKPTNQPTKQENEQILRGIVVYLLLSFRDDPAACGTRTWRYLARSGLWELYMHPSCGHRTGRCSGHERAMGKILDDPDECVLHLLSSC